MRGHCKLSRDGFHRPTIIGDPYSKMTYYKCLVCDEIKERHTGVFYGQERPTNLTLEERIEQLEKEIKELKG